MSFGFDLEAMQLTRHDLSLLSLTVAQSVLESVRDRIPEKHAVALHWPNDVYVDDRKISGILLEAPTPRHVVVGIGINVNNRLSDIPHEHREHFEKYAITSLIDLIGEEIDHPVLIKRFWDRFHDNIEKLKRNRVEFIAEIQQCCLQTGREVLVNRGNEAVHGRCLGIAPDGALRLQTTAGIETVHTGIVSHG